MSRRPLLISPSEWDRRRPLRLEEIRGWRAISYLRFSSSPQEKGDSIARQQAALSRAILVAGLVLDEALEDRARSASKGDHRTKGELGRLLDAIEEGAVPSATVLIVESIDRLTREGVLDAYKMLEKMIRAGIVLLVCGDGDEDLDLYDEHAINGRDGDRLHNEIRAAYRYTRRLSQLASGAHQRRRERVAEGKRVMPNGRVPGWLTRDRVNRVHCLNEHAPTIERMFRECVAGASMREIAAGLNRDSVPTISGGDVWRASRVGAILRDDRVMGYYAPVQWEDGKRRTVGKAIQNYPNAISDELWQAAQEAIRTEKGVRRGPVGKTVPNLFTGHCFCASCGATLRVDTGGGIRRGKRKRHLLCGAYIEGNTCADRTRYDLDQFEKPLVMALLELVRISPKQPSTKAPTAKRLAELGIQIRRMNEMLIQMREAARSAAEPAPTLGRQVAEWARDIDVMEREAAKLTIEAATEKSHSTRAEDNWRMLRDMIIPALGGDVASRDRLRGLLARHPYKIVGDGHGGLEVRCGTQVKVVDFSEPQSSPEEEGEWSGH